MLCARQSRPVNGVVRQFFWDSSRIVQRISGAAFTARVEEVEREELVCLLRRVSEAAELPPGGHPGPQRRR